MPLKQLQARVHSWGQNWNFPQKHKWCQSWWIDLGFVQGFLVTRLCT